MTRRRLITALVLGIALPLGSVYASAFGGWELRGEWVVVAPESGAHATDFDSVRFTWFGGWVGRNECGERESGHFTAWGRRAVFWDWHRSHNYFAYGCDHFGGDDHPGVWHWPLVLERVRRYEVREGRLQLLDAKGEVLLTLVRAGSG